MPLENCYQIELITINYFYIFYNIHFLCLPKLSVCILRSLAFPSPSLNVSIQLINDHFFCVCIMPNLDPWINQNEEHMATRKTITNRFENQLLSIKAERQKMIRPNCHPTYNKRHEKIIELIDWTLEKYRTANIKENNQQNEEATIIDNIIEELDKKREVAINKKKKALLRDEV